MLPLQPRRRALALMLGAGVAIAAAASAVPAGHASSSAAPRAPLAFEDPAMTVVYSGPDHDAQLYISTGTTTPMRELRLVAPGNRTIIAARFSDARNLGQSDLRLDTPEPSLAGLRHAYPPGVYRWRGTTINGRPIAGRTLLSYALLKPPVITVPQPAQAIATTGQVVAWKPIAGARTVHVEIEQVATKRVLTVDLPSSATSLQVPDGFFTAGLEYTMDVKAVGPHGNLTVSDVTFKAA